MGSRVFILANSGKSAKQWVEKVTNAQEELKQDESLGMKWRRKWKEMGAGKCQQKGVAREAVEADKPWLKSWDVLWYEYPAVFISHCSSPQSATLRYFISTSLIFILLMNSEKLQKNSALRELVLVTAKSVFISSWFLAFLGHILGSANHSQSPKLLQSFSYCYSVLVQHFPYVILFYFVKI